MRLPDIPVVEADYTSASALTEAFSGGSTVFLLTPEDPKAKDLISETKHILENYRTAIAKNDIKKIVGLSSMGAHYHQGTGNLVMSHLLEHAFTGLPIEQVFIRPAYYYSNWLGHIDTIRKEGILPTFFPLDMQLPMISPLDVAQFIATSIITPVQPGTYEIMGPKQYSSTNVADAFGDLLGREVTAKQLPKSSWEETLLGTGFSKNAAHAFMEMTAAVIDGKTTPQLAGTVKLETVLSEYLNTVVSTGDKI